MSFENDEIYKKLMTEVLARYIIVPIVDQSKKGQLIGRRLLAIDLYNFLNTENEKYPVDHVKQPEILPVLKKHKSKQRRNHKKRAKI